MSGDPYPSYYAAPAAALSEPGPRARPHSGLGIASFLLGLLVGIGETIVVGWIGYTTVKHPGTVTPEAPIAIVAGLLMLGGLAMAVLGAGLGIGGLFHTNRKRVFALLGLILNVMIVTAFTGLIVLGLAVKP